MDPQGDAPQSRIIPKRFWSHLGRAHFAARQYPEAIEAFMHLGTIDAAQHAFMAATYSRLGDMTAAAAHFAKVRELDPDFEIEAFARSVHYVSEADVEHLAGALAAI